MFKNISINWKHENGRIWYNMVIGSTPSAREQYPLSRRSQGRKGSTYYRSSRQIECEERKPKSEHTWFKERYKHGNIKELSFSDVLGGKCKSATSQIGATRATCWQGWRQEFEGGGWSMHWKVGGNTLKTLQFEKCGGAWPSPLTAHLVVPPLPAGDVYRICIWRGRCVVYVVR